MVQEIHSFDTYEGFIEEFSGDAKFADPHFEHDRSNLYDALERDNRKAYVVTEGDQVKGLFVWLILPDEKYIELLIGLAKEESAIREMLALIEEKYEGHQLDFVVNPRNDAFCGVLREKGAWFEEEQQWMAWERACEKEYAHEVILLSQEYEAEYIEKHNKETYWTAEKVIAAKDRFRVFVAIHNEKVIGYMDVTHCYEKNEPYDLWVEDGFRGMGYEQALVQAAVEMNKPKQMMVLVDIGNADEIEVYEDVGFVAVEGTRSVYATYRI